MALRWQTQAFARHGYQNIPRPRPNNDNRYTTMKFAIIPMSSCSSLWQWSR